MALLINGDKEIYLFVEDEQVDRDTDISTHPVEDGSDITDHFQQKAMQLSLKGKLLPYYETKDGLRLTNTQVRMPDKQTAEDGTVVEPPAAEYATEIPAADTLAELLEWQRNGAVLTYSGRNKDYNLRIQSFNTSHPYTNSTGLDFEMTLIEVKLVTLKVNDPETGEVFTDGTQQVEQGENQEVYHTVQSGDTVWALVTYSYKELGTSVQWVIDNNPDAFSRPGDATTLQIGAILWMGTRK